MYVFFFNTIFNIWNRYRPTSKKDKTAHKWVNSTTTNQGTSAYTFDFGNFTNIQSGSLNLEFEDKKLSIEN